MRVVLILVGVVLVLVLCGWLTVSRSSDTTTINLHTEKIERDTQSAIDRGDQFLQEAGRKGQELLQPDR